MAAETQSFDDGDATLREFCGHLAKPGDETVTCTPMVGRLRYRFFETTEASLVARFN
jgi:hypothetical protein